MSNYDHACTGHGSLAARSQVISTAGLCNDYTFLSGLQAQEIRLSSPDCFPRERCDLDTRLITLPPTTWLLPLPSLYYPLQYMYVLPPLTLHISRALLQLYVTTHHPGWETITLLQLNGQHLSRIQETDLGTHSCHYSHTHTHTPHTHHTHTTFTNSHTLHSHTHTYTQCTNTHTQLEFTYTYSCCLYTHSTMVIHCTYPSFHFHTEPVWDVQPLLPLLHLLIKVHLTQALLLAGLGRVGWVCGCRSNSLTRNDQEVPYKHIHQSLHGRNARICYSRYM